MKKLLSIVALSSLSTLSVADPAFMVGVQYSFGGNFGITAKALSSDNEDEAVIGFGASYYPFATEQKFGLDLGAGMTFDNSAALIGWDFLQKSVVLSAGYADTEKDRKDAAVAPAQPPFNPQN